MHRNTNNLDNILSNPRKTLLSMSIPMFFAILMTQLQNFIDSVWCSGLGAAEVSAISISRPVYMLVTVVGIGYGIGASATVAKFLGANDRENAEKAASITVVFTIGMAILSCIIMWFLLEPLVSFCGGGNNVDLCLLYSRPLLLCSVFLTMESIWVNLLRAEGAARVSMTLSILTSVFNMILDPLLIYVLGFGLAGASYATCLSFILITVLGFWWYGSGRTYIRLRFRRSDLDAGILKDISLVGIPATLEFMLSSLLIIPEQAIVVSCGGADGLVVYIIAFRFIELALIPSAAISKSLIPILSASMGQRDPGKMKECIKIAMTFNFKLQLVLGVAIFLLADILNLIYMNSDTMLPLYDELVLATRIYAVSTVLKGVYDIGLAVLQASRHAVYATVVSTVREFIFLFSYLVASFFSMTAIYVALDFTNLVSMIMVTLVVGYVMRMVFRDMGMEKTGGTA